MPHCTTAPYFHRNVCLSALFYLDLVLIPKRIKYQQVQSSQLGTDTQQAHLYSAHTVGGAHKSSRALRLTKDGLPGTAKKSICPSGMVLNSGQAAAGPMQDKPGCLKETLTKLSPRDGIQQGEHRSQQPSDRNTGPEK